MSKNVSEDTIGVYHLDGSDTRTGLVFLSLISILVVCLSGYLIIVGRLGNGIAFGLVAALMIVGSVVSFVRLRAEITYSFGKTEFVAESTKSRNVHKMAELKSIQLTLIGAGEGSPGSYKVTFQDGTSYWFHGLGRSLEFVTLLAKKAGMLINS